MQKIIKQIISKCLNIDESILSDTMDLRTIGLDSISLIEIIVELEDIFNVTIEGDSLLIENVNTINKLSCAITECK